MVSPSPVVGLKVKSKYQNSRSQHCIVKCMGVEERITWRGRVQSITIPYSCAPTDPNSSAHCVVCSQDERKRNAPNETFKHARMDTIKKSALRASRRYVAAIQTSPRARDLQSNTEPCDIVERQCQHWRGTITCCARAHRAGSGGLRFQTRRKACASMPERGESLICKLTPGNMRIRGRRRLRACQVGA